VLPSMETIDEAEESKTATSSEEINQLTQQVQEDLIVEDKRHFDTLAYFKNRIKEEEEKHVRQQRFLEAKLLQAVTTVEGGVADGDHWLNNTRTPKKEKPKKLTKEDKKLIRARVKKAYAASKKKQTSKMSSDWNALDRQAPIPYVRDPKKKAYSMKHPQSSSSLKENMLKLLLKKLKMIMEFQLVMQQRRPPISRTARLPSRPLPILLMKMESIG